MIKQILSAKIYDLAVETPLNKALKLSKNLQNEVFLKREDLQAIFSFKIRGAYNKILSLSADKRDKGIIAASAGNHAQGVACAAKILKTSSCSSCKSISHVSGNLTLPPLGTKSGSDNA